MGFVQKISVIKFRMNTLMLILFCAFGLPQSTVQNDSIELGYRNVSIASCKTVPQKIAIKKKNCVTAYVETSLCFGTCTSTVSSFTEGIGFHAKCSVCKPLIMKMKKIKMKCSVGKKIRHKKFNVVSQCGCVEVPCGIKLNNETNF